MTSPTLPAPGLYRHFKGKPYYVHRVMRDATNAARYAPVVYYEAIFPQPDDEEDGLAIEPGHFTRVLDEFNQLVPWPDCIARPRWVPQDSLEPYLLDKLCPCGAPAEAMLFDTDRSYRCDGHLRACPLGVPLAPVNPLYLCLMQVLALGKPMKPEDVATKLKLLGFDVNDALDTIDELVGGRLVQDAEGRVSLD